MGQGEGWLCNKRLGTGISAKAESGSGPGRGSSERSSHPMPAATWDWAKKFGKAIGIDKAIAAVLALKDQAFDLAKKGFVFIKDKVLPLVEKLRQMRNVGDELHDRRHPVQGRRAARTRDSSPAKAARTSRALSISPPTSSPWCRRSRTRAPAWSARTS